MSSAQGYRINKAPQRTPTCDTCRSRHQKCGGEQPRCSNCRLRGINCTYNSAKTRAPETRRPPSTTFAPALVGSLLVLAETSLSAPISRTSRPSISDADYDRLYSEIFGDIVRRLNLEKGQSAGSHEDAILDARPGNASLPTFHREVYSIVRERASADGGPSSSHFDANPIRETALERNPDHARKILRDSLPSQEVSRHLLDMFLDYQNSIFYFYSKDEVYTQLALMYEQPDLVSISWFCQMFLIFAVGVQFDDMYDTDGATYRETGQKYIDDAIDENPQSTIWVVRAMLLLCIYEPPTKWNSVWMHLDAAIRGAQRFQLDTGQNLLKELSDNEYQEWRRVWLTVITFDRWVAIFLGRLPRIKESISRDPIFKEPDFRWSLEDTRQNNVTTLAIISGDILRDMYFSEQPSLNTCRQYKSELENWMSSLPDFLQQNVSSGEAPLSPKDQAEAIFHLHFMHLGAWMLVTRPFLLRALKMKTSSNFGSPILSAISSEANLCIDYASRLINSATIMLSSSLTPKKSFIPVFFVINAAHVMILAAVWREKQNEVGFGLPGQSEATPELAVVDASIQILEFCGQRNPFARRYSILIRELHRQVASNISSTKASPGSGPPQFSASSSASMTDSDAPAESPYFQNLRISEAARTFPRQSSYENESPLTMNIDEWPGQFVPLIPGEDESFDPNAAFLTPPDEHSFWRG